jgi:16S rRNA (adenine1518-N6/adenine1519-N6)-dimethyltransferase
VVLKAGSCATEGYEPRQVREEAAVNGDIWVPQVHLAGAGWPGQAVRRGRGQVHGLKLFWAMPWGQGIIALFCMGKSLSRVSSGSLLARTRTWLRRSGLRARKGLGQHFLIDEGVLEAILAAAALTPGDTVIEVGPGLGVLTGELARQAGWVIAIELDNKLADILRKSLAPFDNVVILNEDVLGTDPRDLLEEPGPSFPPALCPYKVVANLPYYITSPVLRHFLEASVRPEVMIVMVQKEVAEAIVAGPGERSLLSISVQFYGRPSLVRYVPSASFYPEPEVDSAILKIDVYPRPAVEVADEKGFFRLVRSGFTAARKQVANSLAQGLGLPKAEVLARLEEAGIAPQRRAETFTLEEWAKLWRVFAGDR